MPANDIFAAQIVRFALRNVSSQMQEAAIVGNGAS
jgi:hypothetical protein